MNHRIIAFLFFVCSLLTIFLGYSLLWHPEYLGLCSPGDDCLGEYTIFGIAKPLYWGTQWLPVFLLGLIFVRREVFWSWLKFIIIPALLAFWFVAASLPLNNGFFAGPFPDRTQATAMMTHALVIVSVIYIVLKYIALYRREHPRTK